MVDSTRRRATVLIVALCGFFPGTHAQAHGIWGHIHVTGWAIDHLPEGELRQFFSDPEVFNAALFGAAFTDSGYAPRAEPLASAARAYAEHTHWEPFVADYIAWMQVHDPPPWEDAVSRKRVGFLLGCAAHGLQDELFDSLFLPQTHYHEQGAQDSVDPATDGFLAQAGHLSVIPEEYLPMDVLLSLYAELDVDITEAVIRESVSVLTSFYVNDSLGPIVAEALGEEYEGQLPWTQAHFLDPEVPGSLRSEILPTMLYLQAIWARLHGASLPEDTVVFWFPNGPRRLRSHDPASPDSWVTVVYGQGVHRESATASWRDVMGTPVSFNTEGTRWGATFGRLHRFMPTEALTPGGQYALTLEPGLARIDGGSTTSPFRLDFQVACTEPGDPECPAMVDIPEVSLDPPVPPTPFEPAPASRPSAVASDTPRSEGGCISGVRPGSTAGTWLVGCLLGLSLWRRLWRPGAVQLRA